MFTKIAVFFFLTLHWNSVALFTLQLDLSPDYYNHFLQGRIYFVENKLSESVESYTKSLKQNPNHKESYYGRGLAYGFMDEIFLEDAEKDFKKYIELENEEFKKTNQHSYGAWAGYNDLAWLQFIQGKYDEAQKTTLNGLKISDFNPWLRNTLAAILIEEGDCKEAKKQLSIAKLQANSITSTQFGEAYSGDHPSTYEDGLRNMLKTIDENINICGKEDAINL
jgi:tetratricopeptide (TPR) repeat protein